MSTVLPPGFCRLQWMFWYCPIDQTSPPFGWMMVSGRGGGGGGGCPPTDTVPEPRNSGRICGAPLIGPPYIPGGCGTPLTFREAITSGDPVKSSLILEPLTRTRPTVSAMQSLACKVRTPLPIFDSKPVPEITPEKEVLMLFFFIMIRRPPRSTLFPYTTPAPTRG